MYEHGERQVLKYLKTCFSNSRMNTPAQDLKPNRRSIENERKRDLFVAIIYKHTMIKVKKKCTNRKFGFVNNFDGDNFHQELV